MKPEIGLVGGGLVGALLARLLARQGFRVEVFERRPDPRVAGTGGGRSINLALAERGRSALRVAGVDEAVMRLAVMMRGRMVHHRNGHVGLQRYGRDDSEVIWSMSRGQLNITLIDAAEQAGARFHFGQRLDHARFDEGATLHLVDDSGQAQVRRFPFVIGADGAGSAMRAAMNRVAPLGERIEPLGHGYKELEIPPAPELGGLVAAPFALETTARTPAPPRLFALEPHALHIWPRGRYMCIALPNTEGSFTVTLFLANEGEPGFAGLPDAAAARAFFAREFADLLPLLAGFEGDFTHNPVGVLSSLYLDRWHLDGRAVVLGDAAHAMPPFHGQGMNCGFEDAEALAALLARHPGEPARAFAEFEAIRKPNARALIRMTLDNYIEMRDSVADPGFLLRQELARVLAERHPGRFIPRYSMVTFTHIPYAEALARGEVQEEVLRELTAGKAALEEIDLVDADARVAARLERIGTASAAAG